MAGEVPGIYIMRGGALVVTATVKGSKGDKGDPGTPGGPGPQGQAAVGVIVSDTAPINPAVGTVWLNSAGT